ncbi:uncharacterized protein LOC127798279 [Diospyros lotus]|uniref:uncharacterized protein LOC127798279 n=1 Tax=Diospyros lotus TaxID=55363 RepID=UPI00225BAD1B|nr:uncharacterized protein LOC127798279 [Diospyros lotus]
MEAAATQRRRSSSSAKRKPFSDTTNLVPISTVLRNLSSSLSFAPNPNPNSKPYHVSENKSETINSSKSNTSIGSSNYDHEFSAPNPRTVPQSRPSTRRRLSLLTDRDNEREDAHEPLVVYSKKRTAEKTKDKGKEVTPFSCPSLKKTKDNAVEDAVPFTCPPLKKGKDNGKAVVLPPSFTHPGKDSGKATFVHTSTPSPVSKRNRRKENVVPLSCPLPQRNRKIWKKFNNTGDGGLSKSCLVPHPKNKKKRHSSSQEKDFSHPLPKEFVEKQRAYFQEVDKFELPEEEVSESELDRD